MLQHRADTGEVSSALSFQPAAGGHLPAFENEYGLKESGRVSTNGHYYKTDQRLLNGGKKNPRRLRAEWEEHNHKRVQAEECQTSKEEKGAAAKSTHACTL